MNKKAIHIFRSVTITFLMAGFLAHLMMPLSSQAQKNAFTRWLNHNVVASGNESETELRNTIKELPEQTGNFWILVQEASELVANHKDHFKIPVSSESQKNHQPKSGWLIEQWNMFQDQKSGFNSVLVESLKVLSNWVPQTSNAFFVSGKSELYKYFIFDEISSHPEITFIGTLIPLVNGISINAP
ncbi:MAG: hypothetical protein R3220_07695 [Balneolaceae bacterium]|nr:hypothetical protein [Balneolaceae bacterium]